MKKTILGALIIFLVLTNNVIFASDEDDDVPYLSDDDIAAIEMTLPDDVPEIIQDIVPEVAVETKDVIEKTEKNEISSLNTSQRIYHLLILDRTLCSLNSDIDATNGIKVLYKFRHGANGYLIALYTSSKDGPVFPHLPDKSRIITNLMSVRKATITEYVNSNAFRKFVTNRRITSELQKTLRSN